MESEVLDTLLSLPSFLILGGDVESAMTSDSVNRSKWIAIVMSKYMCSIDLVCLESQSIFHWIICSRNADAVVAFVRCFSDALTTNYMTLMSRLAGFHLTIFCHAVAAVASAHISRTNSFTSANIAIAPDTTREKKKKFRSLHTTVQ